MQGIVALGGMFGFFALLSPAAAGSLALVGAVAAGKMLGRPTMSRPLKVCIDTRQSAAGQPAKTVRISISKWKAMRMPLALNPRR